MIRPSQAEIGRGERVGPPPRSGTISDLLHLSKMSLKSGDLGHFYKLPTAIRLEYVTYRIHLAQKEPKKHRLLHNIHCTNTNRHSLQSTSTTKMKAVRASSALASQLSTSQCTRAAFSRSQSKFVQSKPSSQTRTFIGNPFSSSPQSLVATRTLPYSSTVLYNIISDVSSYSAFVPFCQKSVVTKTSSPDTNGNSWPEEAQLVVGFNADISESFYSRIYCDPGRVVEAVSGPTNTSLDVESLPHHSPRPEDCPARNDTVLTHLLTRWTLKPFPYKPGPATASEAPHESNSTEPARDQCDVNLTIEFKFANPLYATLSSAAAPKVADMMIEAFEKRVKAVLDGPSMGGTSKKAGAMEGVLRPRSSQQP